MKAKTNIESTKHENEQRELNCGFESIYIKNKERYIPSNHYYNRIVYVLSGSIIIDIEKYHCCTIQQFHLAFIEAGKRISFVTEEDQSSAIILKTNKIERFTDISYKQSHIQESDRSKQRNCNILRANVPIMNFFDMIGTYLEDGIYYLKLHQIKAKELFLLLSMNYEPEQLINFFNSLTDISPNFKSLVKEYAPKATSVNDLLKHIGFERSYFQRRFKQEFGISPYKWLQLQRSARIIQYLKEKNSPLKSVAIEMGFSSQSHFNQFCKKYFGMTGKALQSELHKVKRESIISITDRFFDNYEYDVELILEFFDLISHKCPYLP